MTKIGCASKADCDDAVSFAHSMAHTYPSNDVLCAFQAGEFVM
jgi:hypothetical protein